MDLGNVGLVVKRFGRRGRPQRVRPNLEPKSVRGRERFVDGVGRDRLLRSFGPAVVNSSEKGCAPQKTRPSSQW